jgi:hypothetical protein
MPRAPGGINFLAIDLFLSSFAVRRAPDAQGGGKQRRPTHLVRK